MPRHDFPTIAEAALALEAGRVTAATLVDEALTRMGDGEGSRAFTAIHAKSSREAALAMDKLRRVGRAPSRFAGIPITVKDLYDEAGLVTRAGSAARDGAAAAQHTATAVARLERRGFIIVGRTNMTEFAFSGLGVNPHFGTPTSPWDRTTGRLPGGSSSGAAVASADGMGFGGLGTDTGGSCRIPAALCGVVGYKPTARRVPIEGVLPLSRSLDSVGPIARSVECCRTLDAFIAGAENLVDARPVDLAGLRFAVLQNIVEDEMDGAVARAYARTLARLEAAGAKLVDLVLPEIAEIPLVNAKGGLTASEAYAWHQALIESKGERYDPRILKRIARGAKINAAEYIEVQAARARMINSTAARTAGFDAVICPTVPLVPPAISAVDDETEYNRINMLLLRNTTIANFLDRCSISIPCHRPGEAPVGLMLMGEAMADAQLFAISAAVEALIDS